MPGSLLDTVTLYARYARSSIAAQLSYPRDFVLQVLGHFASTAISFMSIWALFKRFGALPHWSLWDIAVFYGVVNVAFAIAESVGRGFDVFGEEYVRTGEFDRLLLRPRSTVLQLLGHQLRLRALGRLTQGILVLGIGLHGAGTAISFLLVPLLLWTIAGGVALFVGILVGQAALAIWTVESLEIANVLTYGGVQAAQYPVNLYAGWFRRLLTFVIPISAICYYPALAILGKSDPLGAPRWVLPVAPVGGFVFLAIMLRVWSWAVTHYRSTGT